MRIRSIKTKISIVVTLAIFSVTGVLGITYIADQVAEMKAHENEFLNSSVRSASTIAYTLMPPLVENNFVQLNDLVSHFASRSYRTYVRVLDNTGRIVADSQNGKLGSFFQFPQSYASEERYGAVIRRYESAGKKYIDISHPIKAGDLVLGEVRLGLNTVWLDEDKARVTRTVLFFCGAGVILAFLGIILVSETTKKITGPLILLKEAAESMGRGDYNRRVGVIKSNDEVAVLAETFDKMAHDLKESRGNLVDIERLNEAQHLAHLGSWEWDTRTNKVFWSDELFRIYGYEPGEICPDYDLIVRQIHSKSRGQFLSAIEAALQGETPFEMDYTFFREDGSEAVLHTIGRVIHDPAGKPAGMAGTVQDITGQKKAEDALRESEEKFRTIFDNANDGILIASATTRKFIEANKNVCAMLGYTKKEILGLGIEDIHPEDELPSIIEEFESQIRGERMVARHLPVLRKDKTLFYADVCASHVTLGGDGYSIGIFRDTTERKNAEEKIRASLAEKDLLLKEVHHRVKNNLQVVASLLKLQAGYVSDIEARALFEESQKRVEAMSIIHEKLYRSKDLAGIDFSEYVEGLITNLYAMRTSNSADIEIDSNIKGVKLDVNNSIPCGLIINELVSNALRHAFPEGKGKIVIEMKSAEDSGVSLCVADNGIGLPEGIDFRNTKSLGLQLVMSLVGQLGGTIALDRTSGTIFKIAFRA